jgi:hypothetical protein
METRMRLRAVLISIATSICFAGGTAAVLRGQGLTGPGPFEVSAIEQRGGPTIKLGTASSLTFQDLAGAVSATGQATGRRGGTVVVGFPGNGVELAELLNRPCTLTGCPFDQFTIQVVRRDAQGRPLVANEFILRTVVLNQVQMGTSTSLTMQYQGIEVHSGSGATSTGSLPLNAVPRPQPPVTR